MCYDVTFRTSLKQKNAPSTLGSVATLRPRTRTHPGMKRRIRRHHFFSVSTYEAVVVDGEDVLLLGHHVAEAAACGILEGDAVGFGAQNPVDVVAVVQLVVKSGGDLDHL